jgi:molecular chaperone DnaJ
MRILVLLLLLLSLFSVVELKIPNPYKVLGIEKDASEDQIKEGFKKRSKKYHPDRNKTDPKAKEKFEKIVNAYELLKDPQRKRMYDLTGDEDPMAQQQQQHQGFGNFGGFPGGGINIEDLMRAGFFGGGHPGQGQGGQQRRGHTTYTFNFGF